MTKHHAASQTPAEAAAPLHTGDIRIEIARDEGQPPIAITISGTGAKAPVVHAHGVDATHVAATAVTPPDTLSQKSAEPDSTILLKQLFEGDSPAAAEYRKARDMHEPLSHALAEAFAKDVQSIQPDVYKKAMEVVHEVMQHMIAGDMLTRVPADELEALRKDMAAEALKYVKNHSSAEKFNADSLRQKVENSPKVKLFHDKHKTHKGHTEDAKHSPKHPAHHAQGNHAKHLQVEHQGTVSEEPSRALEATSA